MVEECLNEGNKYLLEMPMLEQASNSFSFIPIRALQGVKNQPCPEKARLRKFLKGRLHVMNVITC
jgi:hypothetical protein